MKLTSSLLISASIVVGCLLLVAAFNQRASGQQPAAGPQQFTPQQIGRYQAFMAEPSRDPSRPAKIVVCDTATGACFVHHAAANDGKGAWYTASPPVRQ
jgi:hypothetical protein